MSPEVLAHVETFFNQYPLLRVKQGTVLAYPGGDMPGVMFLREGSVSQYDITNDGSEVAVNSFLPPAFFPMSWAVTGLPNRYYYRAESDCRMHVAPEQHVVTFIRQQPDVLYNLLERVYRGTEGLLRKLAHNQGGTAATLLLHTLIVACKRSSKEVHSGYTLSVSNQALASQTGLTRETVNRELHKLQASQLVHIEYKKITVPNLQALEAALGSRL